LGAGAAELLADGALVALAVAEAVLWRAEELVPGCLAGALSQPAVCSKSTNPKSSGRAFIRPQHSTQATVPRGSLLSSAGD
jgi:hypothetical protein